MPQGVIRVSFTSAARFNSRSQGNHAWPTVQPQGELAAARSETAFPLSGHADRRGLAVSEPGAGNGCLIAAFQSARSRPGIRTISFDRGQAIVASFSWSSAAIGLRHFGQAKLTSDSSPAGVNSNLQAG